MAFKYLPGVQVNTVDGGLVARRIPRTKSTVVIGTSAKGLAGNPYQVIDRAEAALTFGFDGNLVRAMEEVATYSDNVVLFRMGTKAMKLAGIGKEFSAGIAISNVERTSNVVTITTGAAHDLVEGDVVKVAAVTNTGVNGEFTVATAPTGTTFTYAQTGANIVSGADTGFIYERIEVGFAVTFSDVTSDADTRYKIWYKDGVLAVWLDDELVYSNDSGLGVVDTGNIAIDAVVSGNLGLQLGTGTDPILADATTVSDAAGLAGTATEPAPVLTDPVTGVGMTGRETYVALAKALELLENFVVEQVYCPSAVLDHPNVSKYIPSDSTTAENNPATNTDALDWIKVVTSATGDKTYQWASAVVDSEGNTVAAMSGVSTPDDRIAAGFYEANFGYLLANFCQKQGETLGGCVAFIGTRGPKSFRLSDTRDWVGFLPTFGNGLDKVPTVSGKGLLGMAELVGCTSSKLHTLAFDKATGRKPGFFKNTVQQFDGGAELDINQNPVDIGAFLYVFADRAIMTNGFKANYEENLAGMAAGLCSALDEKSNLTNKALNVIQIWKPSQSQMDALTFAKISVLRFKGLGQVPAILHGITAAGASSDYTNLLRVRIKFMLVKLIFDEGEKFIGESTLDGLQLESMRTALEARAVQLQKRGYVSFADFKISTTPADRRLGHARVDVKFTPADELVKLTAFVGITRR